MKKIVLSVLLISASAHSAPNYWNLKNNNPNINNNQNNYGYKSSSGTKYKYNLNNPMDRLRYENSPEQLSDSINIDVLKDRMRGEYGGGAYD